MAHEFDRGAFEADVDAVLERGREAFKGRYKKELEALAGLSMAEIKAISPAITAVQKYDELITVVKEASRVNLAQAELRQQIRRLGSTAVKIAGRIPSLARILSGG